MKLTINLCKSQVYFSVLVKVEIILIIDLEKSIQASKDSNF